ncbi:MAG TPA: prepilin-type N-terminal cleavage/methylation domain-containing protein [Anaerohalosphaeraceae bacterium]|nr:prepilin-type N-terminal cleavage/methylation domain-containing protein [Anaerohalosphaeraceae bacterium]
MKQRLRHNGFSLTEVLLATGVLAIGLVMIAMVFPVGVKLTSTATERTVAATAANEAFAKIQLFGKDPDGSAGPLSAVIKPASVPPTISANLNFMYPSLIPDDERWYPSEVRAQEKKYHWSAMVRKISDTTLQTTVFVSRLLSQNASYYDPNHPQGLAVGKWPEPFPVQVEQTGSKTLKIKPAMPNNTEYRFFTEGSVLLVSRTGAQYRVVEIKSSDNNNLRDVLVLDRDYMESGANYIWVVPPASGSTRNPCIGVYQRLLEF